MLLVEVAAVPEYIFFVHDGIQIHELFLLLASGGRSMHRPLGFGTDCVRADVHAVRAMSPDDAHCSKSLQFVTCRFSLESSSLTSVVFVAVVADAVSLARRAVPVGLHKLRAPA